MNKRFLNKKIDSSLLKQSLPENVLQKSRSRGQIRKTKSVTNYNLNSSERTWQWSAPDLRFPSALRSSKLDKMRQAETQIVREFVEKELKRSKKDSIPVEITRLEAQQKESARFPCSEATQAPSSSVFCLKSKKKEFQLHCYPDALFAEQTMRTRCLQSKHLLCQTSLETLKEFAEENVFLLLSIEQIRSVLVSKRTGGVNQKQTPSELRDQLLESRKIRFLYGGLSKRELERNIKRARQFLGSTADNLLIVLESRLDVALERCCFFSSIRLARQSIVHKRVKVNEKIVNTPGYWLQPGDVIQVQLLEKCLANTKKSKSNLLFRVDPALAQAPVLSEQPVPFCTQSGVNLCSQTLTKSIAEQSKETQRSRSVPNLLQFHSMCRTRAKLVSQSETKLLAKRPVSLYQRSSELGFSKNTNHCFRNRFEAVFAMAYALHTQTLATKTQQTRFTRNTSRKCYRQSLILESLLQLECLLSNVCLQAAHARPLKGIGTQSAFLRCLSINKKALLRLNRLIEASELYLATQNKAHFSNLFLAYAKHTQTNSAQMCTSMLKKGNNLKNTNLCPILDSIDKTAAPHLALHIQQALKKKTMLYTGMQKQDTLINKNVNQQDCLALLSTKKIPNFVAISNPKLCNCNGKPSFTYGETNGKELSKQNDIISVFFDDTLYHVYFYWLQLTKRLLSRNVGEQLLRQDLLSPKKRTIPFQSRRTKPLHMEVSYQSCTAIFLYPPQRVYLPALVNVDLLVKAL